MIKLKDSPLLIAFILISFLTLFASCSEEENATIAVDTNVSDNIGTPPENITGFTIAVSGSGIDEDIIKSYMPNSGVILMELPAGKGRIISIDINIEPSENSIITAYGGTAVVDLRPGVTTEITMKMVPSETKIIVPDCYNNRIVQLDSIAHAATTWKAITATQIGYSTPSTFWPSDIAFDAQGRMYIANRSSSNGVTGIVRVDKFDVKTPVYTEIIPSTNPTTGHGYHTMKSISADMVRGYIYYTATHSFSGTASFTYPGCLYRVNLDGSPAAFGNSALAAFTTTGGVEDVKVDFDGSVYILVCNASLAYTIYKFNPDEGSTYLAASTYALPSPLSTSFAHMGILVKDNYILVGTPAGVSADNSIGIMKFTKNLSYISEYGTNQSRLYTTPMNFYNAHRFLAVLNRKITIMDTEQSVGRLVSIDNPAGSGWITYGEYGAGTGFFNFSYS
jgi:hypothetical protein